MNTFTFLVTRLINEDHAFMVHGKGWIYGALYCDDIMDAMKEVAEAIAEHEELIDVEVKINSNPSITELVQAIYAN